jgi:hypothetical protein
MEKSYNLERARLDIQFSSAVDISSYDFSLNGLTSILQNNYIISWTQQDSFSAHLNILKDNSSPLYSELNSQISPFLEISFHPSLLTVGVSSVDLAESSYRYGNQVINFNEYAVENNRFTKNYFASPDITSFSPNEVCAGIKADQSSGMPIVDGFVIINGNNFGDIDPSDFHNLIPNDYRVEFNREQTLNTNSFKMTPLPEDYEYWTNTAIKVRVPTAGWLIGSDGNVSGDPLRIVSTTGRITVKNPDGSAHTGDEKLLIKFANFNAIEVNNESHSFSNKLINTSTNGGYYFVFDPSFNNIYPSNINGAKQEVIDALCEWNMITDAKLEVIDVCPPNTDCFVITYENFGTEPGSSTIALARGFSAPSNFACPDESVIRFMRLSYNSEITDWKLSSDYNPFVDKHIIKTAAYHEIGHLLQLGHVYNEDALMHPFYSNNAVIDTDAEAGGTHVSNVSALINCSLVLIKGGISGCTTPTFEIQDGQKVTLLPNPTYDWILLNFEDNWLDYQFSVYDISGKLIKKGKILAEDHKINVQDLAQGNYVLSLVKGSYSKSIKFSKF